jgi:hypothetical protein
MDLNQLDFYLSWKSFDVYPYKVILYTHIDILVG